TRGICRSPWAVTETVRLDEFHEYIVEERVEAELACGRHNQLIGELQAMGRAYPLRERAWGQRMVALYRSGRQADALRVYQDLRRLLADEVGLEPSPDLARLESAVLRHDPELDVVRPAPPVAGGPAVAADPGT